MDGVAASVYTDIVGAEIVMHNAMAIGRMLWRLAPRFEVWLHANGMNQQICLSTGEMLPKVSSEPSCHTLQSQRQH